MEFENNNIPNSHATDHVIQNSNDLGCLGVESNGPVDMGHVFMTPSRPGPALEGEGDLNVGQSTLMKSRKRSRLLFHNSPEDVESMPETIPSRLNTGIDLNTRVTDNPVDAYMVNHVPAVDEVIVGNGGGDQPPPEVVTEAVEINSEVKATVQVCSLVGINLNNSFNLVAEEVVAENGLVDN